jgi:hypothetical protein
MTSKTGWTSNDMGTVSCLLSQNGLLSCQWDTGQSSMERMAMRVFQPGNRGDDSGRYHLVARRNRVIIALVATYGGPTRND